MRVVGPCSVFDRPMDIFRQAVGAVAVVAGGFALSASPSAAADGAKLVISGAGFGHGVGMSQYGAYGYALHGADYKTILGHYYTGTTIQPIGARRRVRVLLKSSFSAKFKGASSTVDGHKLDPAKTYTAVPSAATQVILRDATGKTVATTASPLRVRGSTASPLLLRGKAANGTHDGHYRGALEFRATPAGGLLTINSVGLEDYVRGVVGAESPANWPAAALEAQAVAARTYAITTAKAVTNGFDQFADTRSQVYTGIKAETTTTDAAVAATEGEIVAYNGTPAVTFFFSTSGGRTENVENAFADAEPEPWLVSVDDPYDTMSPAHRWTVTKSLKAATRSLHGLVKGSLRSIRVVKRGASPRVTAADLIGTGGTTRVTGLQLKSRLKLRDTWMSFKVVSAAGNTITTPNGTATTTEPTATAPTTPTGGASPTPTTTTGGTSTGGGAGPT